MEGHTGEAVSTARHPLESRAAGTHEGELDGHKEGTEAPPRRR